MQTTLTSSVCRDIFLDGGASAGDVLRALVDTEAVVKNLVVKASFVRQAQTYLGQSADDFLSLYHVTSRHVNTRNLWLLMADWENLLNRWKSVSQGGFGGFGGFQV